MDQSYPVFNRNGPLGFAAALAQGVSSGVESYQAQKYKNAQLAMQQQNYQSEQQLRQMQMAKMQQEMAPIQNLGGKLQALDSIEKNGGYEFNSSVKKDLQQQFVDAIKTPQQIQAVQQYASKLKQSMPPEMGYSNDSTPTDAQAAGAVSTGQQLSQQQQPQQQPQASAGFMTPRGQMMPFDQAKQTLDGISPYEMDRLSKYRQAQNMGIYQQGQLANRDSQNYADFISKQNVTLQKAMANAKDNDTKTLLGTLKAQNDQILTGMKGGTAVDVANIRGDAAVDVGAGHDAARLGAAKIGAAAKGKGGASSKNPDVDLLNKQILDNQKAQNFLDKPQAGMSFESPDAIASKKQDLIEKGSQLQKLRALVMSGKKLGDAAQSLGVPIYQNGQAPQSAPAQRSGAAPTIVPQGRTQAPAGNAPAFSRSQGQAAIDAMRKLPEGSSFTLDGQAFKIQGGTPVPAQ